MKIITRDLYDAVVMERNQLQTALDEYLKEHHTPFIENDEEYVETSRRVQKLNSDIADYQSYRIIDVQFRR